MKQFAVIPADRTPIDYKKWRIEPPSAGTNEPVTLSFGKPLDRVLLGLMIAVCDSDGKHVEGKMDVSENETQWSFYAWDALENV